MGGPRVAGRALSARTPAARDVLAGSVPARSRAGRDPGPARRRPGSRPGRALLSPSVTRTLISSIAGRGPARPVDASPLSVLTDREREVLARVAAGMSNDEIGAALFMSPLTAKTHVNRMMTKLRARDRAQLVVIAYETGLVRAGCRRSRIT